MLTIAEVLNETGNPIVGKIPTEASQALEQLLGDTPLALVQIDVNLGRAEQAPRGTVLLQALGNGWLLTMTSEPASELAHAEVHNLEIRAAALESLSRTAVTLGNRAWSPAGQVLWSYEAQLRGADGAILKMEVGSPLELGERETDRHRRVVFGDVSALVELLAAKL